MCVHVVATDNFSPDSKCLLCTVYLCVLAFVYSPAPKDASFAGAGRQLHVNKTSWLLEIAVHSYADSSHEPNGPDSPHVPKTPSGDPAGSRGELWELGLQHEAFLHDPATDTTVLVASEDLSLARARGRKRRLVVAFRGTKSRENFRTDFDFLPMTIDLKETDRPLGVGAHMRSSSRSSSNSSSGSSSEGSGGGGEWSSHLEEEEEEDEDLLSVVGGAGRRCGGYGGCLCGACCCCCPGWLLPNCFGLSGLLQPRAHRGFWRAYRSVSPELRKRLRSVVSRMHDEARQFAVAAEAAAGGRSGLSPDVAAANEAAQGVELLVVGHSLGGALANICALDIGTTLFQHQTRSWRERLTLQITRSTEVITSTVREIGYGLHIVSPRAAERSQVGGGAEAGAGAAVEGGLGGIMWSATSSSSSSPEVELGLYTYGAPRVGNHRFGALLLRALGGLPQVWRVVCLRDLVVDVNPSCLGTSVCPIICDV